MNLAAWMGSIDISRKDAACRARLAMAGDAQEQRPRQDWAKRSMSVDLRGPRLPAVLRRHSASPRSRADSVMERVMNPALGRDEAASPAHRAPGLAVDLAAIAAQLDAHEAAGPPPSPSYVKAPAFDRELHATYVAQYPTGVRGLFILVQSPILMLAIGMFAAGVGLTIDFWLAKIAVYHSVLSVWGFRYFLLSALLAVTFSAVLVHVVCPQAAGSGLPFMKVALSGIDMSEYMSLKCVVTKIVGLVAAMAAGLSIGKEGPFIMISCGFASVLMNTTVFRRIYNDETKRLEMLACAVAAGVAATFGSPFGGVLFGVEVTSHFYLVGTLPRAFFTAIVGALLVSLMTANSRYGLLASYNMGISDVGDLHGFTVRDLAVFSALGVVCGLGGALFNHCVCLLVRARDHFLSPHVATLPASWRSERSDYLRRVWNGLGKKVALVLVITFISCFLEFYGDSAWFIRHGSPRRILAALFSKDARIYSGGGNPMSEDGDGNESESEADSLLLSRSLVTYLPLKFILTLVSITLPIPAGLFTPTFVIGGIFGRLVGEAIRAFQLIPTLQYEPFEFAIVGAAAFSSGVTHAISTAVIIMEVSHTDGLNLPVSVAILASYFTAKRFTESVYDMLITTSKMPRLKKLPKAAYDVPSWEVMKDVNDMKLLTPDSTYRDALNVLTKSQEPVFPIVDSYFNRFLLATVTRVRLVAAVNHCRQELLQKAVSAEYADPGSSTRTHAGVLQTPSSVASSTSSHRAATSTTWLLSPLPSLPRQYLMPTYGTGEHEHDDDLDHAHEACDAFVDGDLLNMPIRFSFKRGGKFMDWVRVMSTCSLRVG